MKEQITNVLTIFMPLGLVVATILDKPNAGCIVFAIGFVATLELIANKKK
tara:strand:- start:1977 stop:2126 length:150 start_codon:yes stop_codon:yes gene_type:complete